MEIRRKFTVKAWRLENSGGTGRYEKVDADTVQYVMDLPAHEDRTFAYDVTFHRGSRGNR